MVIPRQNKTAVGSCVRRFCTKQNENSNMGIYCGGQDDSILRTQPLSKDKRHAVFPSSSYYRIPWVQISLTQKIPYLIKRFFNISVSETNSHQAHAGALSSSLARGANLEIRVPLKIHSRKERAKNKEAVAGLFATPSKLSHRGATQKKEGLSV